MLTFLLRWKISRISRAAAELIRRKGVDCRTWWFGAYYINPKHLVFVLCVPTDQERDLLRNDVHVTQELRALLEKYSWPVPARADVVFDVESQETVQRENNGNWWYHYK